MQSASGIRYSYTLFAISSIYYARKVASTFFTLANPLRNKPRTISYLKMSTCSVTKSFGSLSVAQFPCLSDNYGFLIHDERTGQTAAIDTPDGKAYKVELTNRGWNLTHILNTHHHWDHTGGNLDLKSDGVTVHGPASEAAKIPGLTNPLRPGDDFVFGSSKVQILDVGGHTLGHIAYYFPEEKLAFVGDSLFALGCGRMFEGTKEQFFRSLKTLRELPDETVVYW